jgi:glutamine synthetase
MEEEERQMLGIGSLPGNLLEAINELDGSELIQGALEVTYMKSSGRANWKNGMITTFR